MTEKENGRAPHESAANEAINHQQSTANASGSQDAPDRLSRGWREVKKDRPCIACGKPDWCTATSDGEAVRCMRSSEPPAGWRLVKRPVDGGSIFASGASDRGRQRRTTTHPRPTAATPAARERHTDFSALATRYTQQLDSDQQAALAGGLGVTPAALRAVGIGWATVDDLRSLKASGAGWPEAYPDGAFAFPARSGDGRIVGFSFRAADGRKGSPAGSTGAKTGIFIPSDLHDLAGDVLIVEGASDVAACCVLGLPAVGRPSNRAGAEDVLELLVSRGLIVVGERDAKPFGAWPGRDGAISVAQRIANDRGDATRWTLTPKPAKDVRSWLQARIAAGLDLADGAACKAAAQELLAALVEAAEALDPEKRPSQADALVALALDLFELGRSETDEPFAIRKNGANVAIMFRGSRDALRGELSREFRSRFGKVPGASALADALVALQGMSAECPREAVHLRVAGHGDAIVLDLGDDSGNAAIVTPSGWTIAPSPLLFRRTELTGALPMPERGGRLEELRNILNVSAETWPLLRGWLVAALIPELSHVIVLASGLQGSAKTTGMRYAIGLVDASPAPVESQPCDVDRWAVRAQGSWCILLDNVSGFPRWFGDCLCKASTGDGLTKRTLYSDSGLTVLTFRRVIAVTSIDPGALAGDLGERLLLLDFAPISPKRRRGERELDRAYAKIRPRALAGLLDLLVSVLARLDDIDLDAMPRMAEFSRILAALDAADGRAGQDGSALSLYCAQAERVSLDVVESDAVSLAIIALVDAEGGFTGSAGELLAKLTPCAGTKPRGWPENARALAGRIRRLIPALEAIGIVVVYAKGIKRTYTIRRGGNPTVSTVLPSEIPADDGAKADFGKTVGEEVPSATVFEPTSEAYTKTVGPDGMTVGPSDRSHENQAHEQEKAVPDGEDGEDGTSPTPSAGRRLRVAI
jgi:hypothetical protein